MVGERGMTRRRLANFRIQATAGGLRSAFRDGEASPAAPDPERSPYRGLTAGKDTSTMSKRVIGIGRSRGYVTIARLRMITAVIC